MSAKPENTFVGSVHKYLPPKLYRMKNHNIYNAGVADCWYSGRADLWIEYKFIVIPKRDDTVIDLVAVKNPSLSVLQQDWLFQRHVEGRKVGVIVGCKDGGVWYPGVTWGVAATAKEFRSRLESRQDLAKLIVNLTGGPP